MGEQNIEIEIVNTPVNNGEDSKTLQGMQKQLDELERGMDELISLSRRRGFAEGCLVTLSTVSVGGLIVYTIKQKNK